MSLFNWDLKVVNMEAATLLDSAVIKTKCSTLDINLMPLTDESH